MIRNEGKGVCSCSVLLFVWNVRWGRSCLPVDTLKIAIFLGRSRGLPSEHPPCELSLTLQQGVASLQKTAWHITGSPDLAYTLLWSQIVSAYNSWTSRLLSSIINILTCDFCLPYGPKIADFFHLYLYHIVVLANLHCNWAYKFTVNKYFPGHNWHTDFLPIICKQEIFSRTFMKKDFSFSGNQLAVICEWAGISSKYLLRSRLHLRNTTIALINVFRCEPTFFFFFL